MEAKSTEKGGGQSLHLGRRGREAEFSRVLAFSDGVFAIAITLLVLQLDVPGDVHNLGSQLEDQVDDLFAFALSFAVLGRVWWTFHHRLFSGLAVFNTTLIAMNFVYLALVTLVPFTSELLGDYGREEVAVILYAVNIGLLSLTGGVMVQYAFRKNLMDPELEKHRDEYLGPSNWVAPAVFLLSIPLALVNPRATTLLWLLILAGGPGLVRRLTNRGSSD